MAIDSRLGSNGDIRVSVDGGQTIDVNVGSGGLESLGRRAFTVGVAEGAAVTIDGDYRKMRYKPTINGVTIVGDVALTDLSLRAVYYDSTENWDAQEGLVSEKGAIYLYSDYLDYTDDDGNRITIPGIRVGDGKTLLRELQFAGGGSSGGTTNYNALRNKPKINGVTLQGDVGLEDLSLKAVFYASTAVWDKQRDFIPSNGDLYIYSDYSSHTNDSGETVYTPAIRIGDGVTALGELQPIISYSAEDARREIVSYLSGINALVSDSDREKWNHKNLKIMIDPGDEECLRFYYE